MSDFDTDMRAIEARLAKDQALMERLKKHSNIAATIAGVGALLTLLFPIRGMLLIFLAGVIGIFATLVRATLGLMSTKRILRDLETIRAKHGL